MSIIVDNISYIYNKGTAYEKQVLKNLSCVIGENEYIGLLGHTGCGKSTFIQHLNGLLKPDSGTIYYNGEDISAKEYDRKVLRSNVGLVFQYPEHQLFEMDVFTDVCFGPKNLGLSKLDAEVRAYEALKLVGFKENDFYQSPFELSGGEKRRVAIAGVLAMKPSVLVLDEPTAGLDPKGREEMFELIKTLRTETGISIILVSHSMDDVAENVERIMVMDQGSLLIDDKPREVFKRYEELTSIGLDIPEVTRIMYLLRQKGINVNTDAITLNEAKEEILRVLMRK